MNWLPDWFHERLMRLRGYRRFEVTSQGDMITGWAKAVDYDPRYPTVTYRGWTDEGTVITFHGSTPPPPPLHRNCRCAVEDYAAPK